MLKDLFANRLFKGALIVFVLIIVGGVLYLRDVERRTQEKIARTSEIVRQLNEQKANLIETAEVPERAATRGGHFHADGTWHVTPETPHIQRGVPAESGTTTVTDAPGGTSTEPFSEADTSVENPTQRDADFVFNSPTLYPHEISQWTKDFLRRLETNHPELLRMGQMTSREVLEAYTPSEIEALNKEWLEMKDDFLAEFHALVRAIPEEMRTPVIEEVYKESLEKWGQETAEQSMNILFP